MHLFYSVERVNTTAINAIAKTFGIDAAFTVQKGKANNRYVTNDVGYEENDDGTSICKVLGIRAIPLDRREFENGVSDEVFYWAAIHLAKRFQLVWNQSASESTCSTSYWAFR